MKSPNLPISIHMEHSAQIPRTTSTSSRLLRWLLTLALITFALIAILGDGLRAGAGMTFIA